MPGCAGCVFACKIEAEDASSSLHCSSFLGLPYRILNIILVKPKARNCNEDYRYVVSDAWCGAWGLGQRGLGRVACIVEAVKP